MERSDAISIIEREAAQIASIVTQAHAERTAPVPTCPGWTIEDLLSHLGRVYAMVATVVSDPHGDAPDRDLIPRRPETEDALEWMQRRLDLLLATLREIPEDARRWNFVSGPRSPVEFWWRRQLHETLIHRVDTELAARMPVGPVTPEVGADGVCELLLVSGFREVPAETLRLDQGLSLQLHATDLPETQWTLDVAGRSYARRQGEADVVLRGPAWSLDRWLWRRGSAETDAVIALADVEVIGDLRAAEELQRSI